MKTSPIRPARIEFGAPPSSADFGDVYHPAAGAAVQARHVFLAGNGLPSRWAGQRCFSILETGFGLGNNFLATWAAWRDDPQRCESLVFTSIEAHPPSRIDLARAQAASDEPALVAALQQSWPPAVPGLHVLAFDGGCVQLHLAFGDVRAMLAELRGSFDAFYLDGFAPRRNPAMWDRWVLRALARRAAPQATAATWCVAREVRDELTAAGFEVQRQPGVGGKREMLSARFAPRFVPRRAAIEEAVPAPSTAIVVGAGLAGAWAAFSLARRGVAVTVIERHAEPAQETSGNAGGLFHASPHADDGVHARLHRAAALHVQRVLRPWIERGEVPGAVDGLLRIETASAASMQALIERQHLPPDFVEALDAAAASARAGVALCHPAWWFAGAGWVDPRALVLRLLGETGVRRLDGSDVARLARSDGGWQAIEASGRTLAHADAAVLASGESTRALAAAHGIADWPLDAVRGQVSLWPSWPGAGLPAVPIAGDGYAIAMPGAAANALLCGASAQSGDRDATIRLADHIFNVQRLTRLTGSIPDAALPWRGRVGWRLQTPDRLPIAGPLAALPTATATATARTRHDQVRFVPRVAGLYVCTALGSRGIALAALAGELLAAQACGTPWPLEADLADAIDPARWFVRAARRGARAAHGA